MNSLLTLGSKNGGVETFNGAMDDVRIYNYAMTDMEAADVYHATSGKSVCILDYASWFDFTGPEGRADCVVDIYDLALFADQWLTSYDYPEFADFSANWLSSGLYPGGSE